MPLLTPLQQIDAQLAETARSAANHLANAAVYANRMVFAMLALDDEALTAWLNSRPPEETQALFAAHGQLGEAINAAATVAQSVLENAVSIPAVDTRSVPEKLAAARRVLAFDGAFTVTTLPPEPAEEPPAVPAASDS